MPQVERAEFLRELDATEEQYVRRKLMLGSYTGWQTKAAEYWLQQRAEARNAEVAAAQIALTQKTATWSRKHGVISLIVTAGGEHEH